MLLDIYEYYGRENVREEIASFLIGRWTGIEGVERKWVRWVDGKPLTIKSPDEIPVLLNKYRFIKPRSFYGSIEVFHKLVSRSDVTDLYEQNVAYATPFIDVDVVDEQLVDRVWSIVIDIGRLIRDWLYDNGVKNSLYFLWSGAGLHIRVNEYCFEKVLEHYHPIEIAYVFVEYVLKMNSEKLKAFIDETGGSVKIENLVSMKRVFTAPLSLHRRLDRVAVAFSPDKLEEFTLKWCDPSNPVYEPRVWSRHVRGECDKLSLEAIRTMGVIDRRTILGLETGRRDRGGRESKTVQVADVKEPGRFQVMALLQAARHYLLYGDLDRAKSFGLNRAIFYAWAKYYGSGKQPVRSRSTRLLGRRVPGDIEWVEECGERVQKLRSGYYVMGGVEQRPEDYDHYVVRRIVESGISYEYAWEKTLEYLKMFPKTVLNNPQLFYREVYEPVRDRFIEKVLKKERRNSGLERWLGKK